MIRLVSLFLVTIILVSCSASETKKDIKLKKTSFSKLDGWSERETRQGFYAFQKTCASLNSKLIKRESVFSKNFSEWKNKCKKSYSAQSSKKFFEDNFTPYKVYAGRTSKGKFTGYFEKEIEASFTKDAVYRYPIYTVPKNKDLLNLSREQIENGALKGRGLEIAYAKSAARLFFLHIQGSGLLKLPNGKKVEIGYAAKNSKPYTGIGRPMLDKGLIKHGSAEDIVNYLEENPVYAKEIMNMNKRYIFFNLKKGGPYGSLGVELTDGGSLAVDPKYIPLGLPIWLETTLPIPNKQKFTRLMNAQDTGSAIKGRIRGDIFFGEGEWAKHTASGMNAQGTYYILLPKGVDADRYF